MKNRRLPAARNQRSVPERLRVTAHPYSSACRGRKSRTVRAAGIESAHWFHDLLSRGEMGGRRCSSTLRGRADGRAVFHLRALRSRVRQHLQERNGPVAQELTLRRMSRRDAKRTLWTHKETTKRATLKTEQLRVAHRA